MNTLNIVYSKLNSDNKTELAKHKIEFSLASEYSNLAKKVSSLENDIDEVESFSDNVLIKQVEQLKKQLIKADSKVLSSSKKIKNIIPELKELKNKYENTSKELGVNPKDIKLYNKLLNQIKTAEIYATENNEIIKNIRFYIKKLN